MGEGKFDEACPKLAESQRLDPGGGTILNLAVCHQGQGRFASAWSEFREAIDLARTDGRRNREQLALEHSGGSRTEGLALDARPSIRRPRCRV